jgi:PKD repeat protein
MKTILSFSLAILSAATSFSIDAPTANFRVNDTVVEIGQEIIIQDLSGNADASSWYFDEGAEQNNHPKEHRISYATAGTKTIVFTVSNPLGSHTITKRIIVNEHKNASSPMLHITILILLTFTLVLILFCRRKIGALITLSSNK